MGDQQQTGARRALASPSRLRRLTGRCAAATALLFAVGAPAASAEPVPMTFADPVDQLSTPAADLVSGTLTQDPLTGVLKAHVELAGAPVVNEPFALRIFTGNLAPDGRCVYVVGQEFITMARLDGGGAMWTLGLPVQFWSKAVATVDGNAINVTVDGGASTRRTATCGDLATGSTQYWPDPYFDAVDEVLAKAELKATVVGGQTGPAATSDRDGDKVADMVDRCPTDPGTGPDGCPLTKGAKSLRLGARRIVVDRLLSLAPGATACPAKVKIIVKQTGHRLGAAKLPATATGAFCSVQGVVRLKRHRKRSVVHVVISGPGIATVQQQIVT